MRNKIMVVDDDRQFLDELEESLALSDYEVVAVCDPKRAYDEAQRTRPDLILLDLKMPDESGFQVACKIKYFSTLCQVPILAMTGYFFNRSQNNMLAYGFKDFLVKPFDPIELVSKIEKAL